MSVTKCLKYVPSVTLTRLNHILTHSQFRQSKRNANRESGVCCSRLLFPGFQKILRQSVFPLQLFLHLGGWGCSFQDD